MSERTKNAISIVVIATLGVLLLPFLWVWAMMAASGMMDRAVMGNWFWAWVILVPVLLIVLIAFLVYGLVSRRGMSEV
ncbi:MAG: hypothetical protein EPO21_01785 [Chloroflexota bacterium]|nr:MAG: hypothetical protein EPO21_01785 [Chloroflexota bacterium]